MKIQPTQMNFNGIYQYTKLTPYGKNVHGHNKGFNYDVYVSTDGKTGKIIYKLYYITRKNEWVKSFLRFFSNNKAYKEIKSESKS